MTSQAARPRARGALERRALTRAAGLIALCVLIVGLWPVACEGPSVLRAGATLAGALAILLPTAAYSRWAERAAPGIEGARRVLGLAAVKLIGTMTALVIAFAAFADKALWVLVGVIAASIAQSIAIVLASETGARRRKD
ncbi:MAG: hypothetical protein AAGI15_12350 [Pseudomonadota bacterium]